MNRVTAFVGIAVLMPLTACAATVTSTDYRSVDKDDYRISVEIPLETSEFGDEQILRVDELLDERTDFDAADFELDEVVLVARSADATGSAELLVLEWRSGAYDIPAGREGDWFEVRIPAPDEDPGGGWLLDLSGDVKLDFLVVVMQPRPRVVAEKTVYRTRTVYRNVDGHRHVYPAYWIYDPTRYYVYHYHDDLWPYRYFAGVWDFRFYHVGFRPHVHRFGRYYGPRYDDAVWRARYRADRARYRHGRDSVAWRLGDAGEPRPRARYDALKRTNPRLRAFHRQDAAAGTANAPTARPDDARSRYEEAKRTHPRLRQFHRNRNASSDASPRQSSSAVTERATAAPRVTGEGPRRIPTLQNRAPSSRSATTSRARTASAPSRNVRRHVAPSPRANAPTVRQQPSRAPRSTSTNVRARTFHQPRSATVRSAPARTRSAPARAAPSTQRSSPAPVRSTSSPRERVIPQR